MKKANMTQAARYELVSIYQSLRQKVQIILELRSDLGDVFKLPVLEVEKNKVLMAQLSPEDREHVVYFASVMESGVK